VGMLAQAIGIVYGIGLFINFVLVLSISSELQDNFIPVLLYKAPIFILSSWIGLFYLYMQSRDSYRIKDIIDELVDFLKGIKI